MADTPTKRGRPREIKSIAKEITRRVKKKTKHERPFVKTKTPYTDGPFCGAPKSERASVGGVVGAGAYDKHGLRLRCKQPAGYKTDHPGIGRCKFHGGNQLKAGHWYSGITHRRVQNIMDEIALVEMNAMDLIPETNLLRALTIDYVNRFDEFQEALLAWYADPETAQKPRRVMDIQDASSLVESISRVVHRMHQIQTEGSISLDTFKRVTEHMGMIVARKVKDIDLLKEIEEEWGNLALDARSSTPGAMRRATATEEER